MELIDTHAHLDFPQFADEEKAILARASAAGVSRVVTVGTDLARSRQAVAVAEWFPNVWATIGIHPHGAQEVNDTTVAQLSELAAHERVVAVGEIGFDHHAADNPDRAVQAEAFRAQAALATERGLPLIIHSRNARQETLSALRAMRTKHSPALAAPGVIHCFEGDYEFATELLDLGYWLSFTATITYPKNEAEREVVRKVPLEKIMVETDCPFLSPQGKRGERNEPANVLTTAQLVAELKGVSLAEVAAQTTQNAVNFFQLDSTK